MRQHSDEVVEQRVMNSWASQHYIKKGLLGRAFTFNCNIVGPSLTSNNLYAIHFEPRSNPMAAHGDGLNGDANGGGGGGGGGSASTTTIMDGSSLIWGTTIDIRECRARVHDFLHKFPFGMDGRMLTGADIPADWGSPESSVPDGERQTPLQQPQQPSAPSASGSASSSLPAAAPFQSGAAPPLYIEMIRKMVQTEETYLNIDARHVYSFSHQLYTQTVQYPSVAIPCFDAAVAEILQELRGTSAGGMVDELGEPQVRLFNLQTIRHLRTLNPPDIDQLVALRGMVIRTSTLLPEMQVAFFRCTNCHKSEAAALQRGRVVEPQTCDHCKKQRTFELLHNRCAFEDKQLVKLQETPDSTPQGETPHTVTLYCFKGLVDVANPGDLVDVTGIFRAVPVRVNPSQRTVKSVYRTYIDVIHLRKQARDRMASEEGGAFSRHSTEFQQQVEEEPVISEEQQLRNSNLERLGRQGRIYERLVASMAPSIYRMDDIKKGVLCQLFSGESKQFGESGRFRGEINILLCGDPGTSKSQMLQYVHKIAPRGIYTSGKGSSAVGLTAYVKRDPDTRELVLESGAIVLSDRGICCIDEFDKMTDSTRAVLHEVMEQQTISLAKAGIIATLNARTSILASANPLESRYNPNISVVDNLQLPPTLLSRFDLIYLVLDKVDADSDRHLAQHLVSLYSDRAEEIQDTELDLTTLTEYISFAKRNYHPVLSPTARQLLVDRYVRMRQVSSNRRVISATTRQLESLIRLSEAHARLRLSRVVEEVDVEEAVRLVQVALQQAATDPRTGLIDMDVITTGTSTSARAIREHLLQGIREALRAHPNHRMDLNTMIQTLSRGGQQLAPADMFRPLQELSSQNIVILTGPDRLNPEIRLVPGADT